MSSKLKDMLFEFVDELEQEYSDLEGIEIKLEHPILDGARQSHANIKEFMLVYLHKEVIPIK